MLYRTILWRNTFSDYDVTFGEYLFFFFNYRTITIVIIISTTIITSINTIPFIPTPTLSLSLSLSLSLRHANTNTHTHTETKINLNWRKAIPLYGSIWDKYQPHSAFMCSYDIEEIQDLEAWKRSTIGFAGPYGQLIYMIVVGTAITPKLFPDKKMFVIGVMTWTLVYLYLYSIWFHEDPYSDFKLMVRY